MAVLGKADVVLVPKFEGLSAAVDRQLKEVEGKYQSSGGKSGDGFGKGLLSSSATFGVFSNLASRAMDTVASHVGDAVSRFDTLNNYPKVMQSLGYAADDADRSISTMSDRLSTLPTRLDDMASTVQGLAVITGDLDQATEAGLALNDMLIASGSSTQLTTAAMEQFRQMLSKGKPEMEDWKSLTSAMPGQLDQLAKSMLGPTANANDLYAALGGGGKQATITMDELLDEIIRLDKEGGEGFASFQEQAETATGGIATSMANAANAVTKGIAGTLDAIGKENIAGVFNDFKGAINDAFGVVNKVAGEAAPILKDVYDSIKPIAPVAAKTAAAFMAFKAVGGIMGKAGDAVKAFSGQATVLDGVNAALGKSFSPVSIGIGLVTSALSVGVALFTEATRKSEDFEKATRGLEDAVSDSVGLADYSETIKTVGDRAGATALSVDDLMEAIGSHVDRINENNEAAQTQIAQLNTAQQVLNDTIGVTDLSADAQGRLEWALKLVNDQFGLSITQADVLAGEYSDQNGEVVNLRDSINQLIESKKEEARVSALTENLTELYAAQAEAQRTYAAERKKYNEAIDEQVELMMLSTDLTYEEARAQVELDTAVGNLCPEYEKATEALKTANEQVVEAESQLGTLSAATSENANAYDTWAARLDGTFEQILLSNGTSIAMLKEDLAALGADTEALSSLTDEQLFRIADCYDGTAASVAVRLAEMGVNMSNASAETAARAQEMTGAIAAFGDSFAADMQGIGVDTDYLALKLAEAGVSTETLKSIGSANLYALAQECGEDMASMIAAIQSYNDKDIEDKDGDIDIEHSSMTSSLDEISVWNSFGSYLGKKVGEVVTSVTKIINERHNAAGGIRLNAEGGIRYHADGAIATKAVPLDIVGEDGAEAIVPLTNRRYSQPFVDLIAEGVAERIPAGDGAAVIAWLERNLGDIISDRTPVMGSRDFARMSRRAVAYEI